MRVEVRIICLKRSEGCIMEMGKFDCMAVVGATGGEARVNGTRGAMLKKAAQGNDVDVVAVCPNKEITGKCPNKGTIKSRHSLLLSILTCWQNAYTRWGVRGVVWRIVWAMHGKLSCIKMNTPQTSLRRLPAAYF
jgi:hypothetical protein